MPVSPVRLIDQGTLAANGSTAGSHISGGTATVSCSGTFGSGTMTIQISLDGGTTYVAIDTTGAKTADATFNLERLPDCYLRWTLTGATSPSIKWFIAGAN